MYERIEYDFKEKSKHRKYQKIFLAIVVLFTIALVGFIRHMGDKINEYVFTILFLAIIFVFVFASYIVVLVVANTNEKNKFKYFFNILENIDRFREIRHQSDIKILKEILDENNINTRPKVQEVLRHYQCLLPRKIIGKMEVLNFMAVTISLVALITSESVLTSMQNVQTVVLLCATFTLLYIVINVAATEIFRLFGKDAFYTRLESSVAEIFMSYYDKPSKKNKTANV